MEALRLTTRLVVRADWLFTTPAIVIQPATGAWLMLILGYRFDSRGSRGSPRCTCVAGACWIPVVVIQYRLRALTAAASSWDALPAAYDRLMRWWVALGAGAFAAVLGLFALMVFRPGL